jgi:hypothetical protein
MGVKASVIKMEWWSRKTMKTMVIDAVQNDTQHLIFREMISPLKSISAPASRVKHYAVNQMTDALNTDVYLILFL